VVDQLGGDKNNHPAFITEGNNTFQPGSQHLDGYQSFQNVEFNPKLSKINPFNRILTRKKLHHPPKPEIT
jgi:hypothetical protein